MLWELHRPKNKRILLLTTDDLLLGRIFSVLLESQHERLASPPVIWSLECLLGAFLLFSVLSIESVGGTLPTSLISFFLQAVQVVSFLCNLCFNSYGLLKPFTSRCLSLGPSHFCTQQFIESNSYLLGKVVTLKNLIRSHLSFAPYILCNCFLSWISKSKTRKLFCALIIVPYRIPWALPSIFAKYCPRESSHQSLHKQGLAEKLKYLWIPLSSFFLLLSGSEPTLCVSHFLKSYLMCLILLTNPTPNEV